ncbi:MAG: hypothetical protein K9G33_15165 [Sneathiella sp.]|nr:hypothetical protein [Sneathiella sp.]
MAEKKAKKAEKKLDRRTGQNILVIWILIFVGLGLVFIPPTMLVLLSGMIPSIIATLLNSQRAGDLASLIAFNLAGVIPVVGILWERGQTFHEASLLLTDVYMWLAMFGGAVVALFLSWAVPVVVFAAYELQAKATAAKLLKQRAGLVEEWGGQFVTDIKSYTPTRR